MKSALRGELEEDFKSVDFKILGEYFLEREIEMSAVNVRFKNLSPRILLRYGTLSHHTSYAFHFNLSFGVLQEQRAALFKNSLGVRTKMNPFDRGITLGRGVSVGLDVNPPVVHRSWTVKTSVSAGMKPTLAVATYLKECCTETVNDCLANLDGLFKIADRHLRQDFVTYTALLEVLGERDRLRTCVEQAVSQRGFSMNSVLLARWYLDHGLAD